MVKGGLTTRGPRNLLRQIREAMAGGGPAQDRLDMVVRVIAQSMVAEVCSIYLRRASGELELFATQGLNPEAVHNTRLRPRRGSGRRGGPSGPADQPVGRPVPPPASPIVRKRAKTPSTPSSARPCCAAAGPSAFWSSRTAPPVAMTRKRSRTSRPSPWSWPETVASGELLAQDELRDVEVAPHRPERLKGQKFAEGLAYGVVVQHEAPLAPEQLLSDDPVAEEKRLAQALSALKAGIDAMLEGGQSKLGGTSLEGAGDLSHVRRRPGLEPVAGGGGALGPDRRGRRRPGPKRAPRPLRQRPRPLYPRAAARLRGTWPTVCCGCWRATIPAIATCPTTPFWWPETSAPPTCWNIRATSCAVCCWKKARPPATRPLSPAPCRSPASGVCKVCATACPRGDQVIVDGETGEAYLRPRPDMLAAVQSRMVVREQRRAEFDLLRDTPAVTKDGTRITVLTNAGLAVDLENLDATGAEGIGLFRTEFQFMVSDELPRLDAQTALYKLVLDAAGNRPVTFRTLDIGGDKVLPYLDNEREGEPGPGPSRHPSGAGPSGPAADAGARPVDPPPPVASCGSCSP